MKGPLAIPTKSSLKSRVLFDINCDSVENTAAWLGEVGRSRLTLPSCSLLENAKGVLEVGRGVWRTGPVHTNQCRD